MVFVEQPQLYWVCKLGISHNFENLRQFNICSDITEYIYIYNKKNENQIQYDICMNCDKCKIDVDKPSDNGKSVGFVHEVNVLNSFI